MDETQKIIIEIDHWIFCIIGELFGYNYSLENMIVGKLVETC